jgi:predicted methyltransferase
LALPDEDPIVIAVQKKNRLLAFGCLCFFVIMALEVSALAQASADDLKELIAGPQRSDKNRIRDPYRHPLEVLTFFGVKPDSTLVEILPGSGGYWTEILAPYLRDHGRYIAAIGEDASSSNEVQKDNAGFRAKIAGDPRNYGKVELSQFAADRHAVAPPESADFVLTFRNIHNWMADRETIGAFKAFYTAMKPGGILGVEEHRGRTDEPQDPLAKSGYVREDFAIGIAEAVGFRFEGSSEVNANPKDTKDYPVGVWALPPTFRLKDQDREKYAAIGESDRFILKFVKPLQ